MISIVDLVTGYDDAPVLEGVNLSVSPGQTVTVIGGNGAGKSTLLRAVSGLIRAWRGRIAFDGTDVQNRSPAEIVRRGIAHVPEGRRIFPGLTVANNLQIGAYSVRDSARTRENLERVYEMFPILRERADQVATTLSGGEQQMLAIGRALMSSPKVLLLDEPTMGLAPIIVEQLLATLSDLRNTGIAMLLVEQNAAFAVELADHIAVLQEGRIVASGRQDDMPKVDELVAAYLGG